MGGTMEYGITIPRGDVAEQPSPWKYLTNFAREAEQMGCAYGVLGDRLESGLDPFCVFAAIAEASGRMRLVTSVLVLPPRGIMVAAKQYAALDVLTGGRVIAGVGTGSMFRDYEVVGMDHNEMWPRFEEGVQAMRAYLTPDAQPFKGRFYGTGGVNLEPKPVQRPSLPIWIGSWGSNAGLRRVARLADGWIRCAGGRPLGSRRCFSSPAARTPWGKCVSFWMRWRARPNAPGRSPPTGLHRPCSRNQSGGTCRASLTQ